LTFIAKRKYSWDERVERAAQLEKSCPFASEILAFYRQIAAFQKSLSNSVESRPAGDEERPSLAQSLDLFVLLPRFQALLYLVASVAPPELAQFARELEQEGAASWQRLLNRYWSGGELTRSDEALPAAFFARTFLQPLARLAKSSR